MSITVAMHSNSRLGGKLKTRCHIQPGNNDPVAVVRLSNGLDSVTLFIETREELENLTFELQSLCIVEREETPLKSIESEK